VGATNADKKLSLQELVHSISEELNNGKNMERVRSYMERFDASLGEWKRYAFFDSKCNYTRNLIATDHKTFTLMALCWNPGKFSPCHDHSGAECFMRMVDGDLQEIRYHWPKTGEENKPMQVLSSTVLKAGQVVFINDSMGLHKVGNPGTGNSCSVHCYIPPYDTCKAWCTPDKTSKASEVNITFYSEGGKKVVH